MEDEVGCDAQAQDAQEDQEGSADGKADGDQKDELRVGGEQRRFGERADFHLRDVAQRDGFVPAGKDLSMDAQGRVNVDLGGWAGGAGRFLHHGRPLSLASLYEGGVSSFILI